MFYIDINRNDKGAQDNLSTINEVNMIKDEKQNNRGTKMNLTLSENLKGQYSVRKQYKLIKEATSVFYDVIKYKNGSFFKRDTEQNGPVNCYYSRNFYFETIFHDAYNMTIVRIRKKNTAAGLKSTYPQQREVFCNKTKTLVPKRFVIHPNETKACHVSQQKISRAISHSEILNALSNGIRVESTREGSYFYFADDIKVVASETNNEIRITTAVRISTFAEKQLNDIIPKVVDDFNKYCSGEVWAELRDDNALDTWKTSDAFIKMKQLDAILENDVIPDEYKQKILNAKGKSGFYTVYQEAQFDLMIASAESRNIGYTYPAKEGSLSIDDFCRSNLSKSARVSIYFYCDSDTNEDWSTIRSVLKRLGVKSEDLSAIMKNSLGQSFIKIPADSFSGNYDERFGCKKEFSYLVDC